MADQELTTYIALFHHRDYAAAALSDLAEAGFGPEAVTVINGREGADDNETHRSYANTDTYGANNTLAGIGVPEEDRQHLQSGLDEGGTVLSLKAAGSKAEEIEKIFHAHSTRKIDEKDLTPNGYAAPAALASAPEAHAAATVIPVVEEELAVGKREVDRGGVRVYRRVVEEPVSTDVTLREEHIVVNRKPVDRAVTESDLRGGNRTIELTESAEEAVVGKTARVVEEIRVGKESTQHTETIHDTVRRTEVEVEPVDAPYNNGPQKKF